MHEKSTAIAVPATELSPQEKKMLSVFAVLGLGTMFLAVAGMGTYMYFLPGAFGISQIIP
jgi:hypothetical protein